MLRIVYWFYYRWSPPYNHIYTYTCDFKFCFISRHVSEIIEHDLNWHTFTYLLHKVCVCVWCVMLGNIFFRKILFRHQFIWICAKEISGENFFSSYVYTYIKVIYLLSIKIKSVKLITYILYHFTQKKFQMDLFVQWFASLRICSSIEMIILLIIFFRELNTTKICLWKLALFEEKVLRFPHHTHVKYYVWIDERKFEFAVFFRRVKISWKSMQTFKGKPRHVCQNVIFFFSFS